MNLAFSGDEVKAAQDQYDDLQLPCWLESVRVCKHLDMVFIFLFFPPPLFFLPSPQCSNGAKLPDLFVKYCIMMLC